MNRSKMKWRLVQAALAAAAVLPSGARAQALHAVNLAPIAESWLQLEARSRGLFESRMTWVDAARTVEAAAALRPVGDPMAVQDLMVAAGGYYFGGRVAEARRTFEQAGERALNDGLVFEAAQAFQRAAILATERHQAPVALNLRQRAARLGTSPLLTPEQRRILAAQFVATDDEARR